MGVVKGFKNLFFGEEDADPIEFESGYSAPRDSRSSASRENFFEDDNDYNGFKVNTGARTRERASYSDPFEEGFSRPSSSSETGYSRSESSYSRTESTRKFEEDRTMAFEQTTTLQIVLARPMDFSEVRSIGDDINAYKTVILNLEMVKSDDAKRILDFLSGVAYANKAQIKMMAQKTFAIMSKNVKFDGKDLLTELENNGYSF